MGRDNRWQELIKELEIVGIACFHLGCGGLQWTMKVEKSSRKEKLSQIQNIQTRESIKPEVTGVKVDAVSMEDIETEDVNANGGDMYYAPVSKFCVCADEVLVFS